MKFVINGLGLMSGGGRTVGLNVTRRLSQVDPENEYLLVLPPDVGYETVPLGKNCKITLIRDGFVKLPKRLYVDHMKLPRICREFGADALFSMSNFCPRKTTCPQMVGIHLSHLVYPESPVWSYMPLAQRLYVRSQIPYFAWACRHVTTFCALTDVIADRLQRIFHIPEAKIRVIPNAVSDDLSARAPQCSEIENRLAPHLGHLKLCYVALGHSHKNHKVLIDAMHIVRRELGIRDVVVVMTIDRNDSPVAPGLLETIERDNLGDCIVNLGRVPMPDVPAVYTSSDALLMPTLLEAYSLSYIEAMHFELPILTSNMDFAHTVCGDAASYFDPLDAADVARAIVEFRNNPALRANLAERSRNRLSSIAVSWEEVTRRYVTALCETASSG